MLAKCVEWLDILRGERLRFASSLAGEVLPLLAEFDATAGWTQTANSNGITAYYKKVGRWACGSTLSAPSVPDIQNWYTPPPGVLLVSRRNPAPPCMPSGWKVRRVSVHAIFPWCSL